MSYFTFQRPRTNPKSGEDSPVLSPGSQDTAITLDSVMLSPGSVEKPLFTPQSLNLALEEPLTPPSSSSTSPERNANPCRMSFALSSLNRRNAKQNPLGTHQESTEQIELSGGGLSNEMKGRPSQDSLPSCRPSNPRMESRSTIGSYTTSVEEHPKTNRPELQHNFFSETNTSQQKSHGVFARLNRRLGVSDPKRSLSHDSPTSPPQTVAILPPTQSPPTSPFSLNLPTSHPSTDSPATGSPPPARGPTRLQSLFARKHSNTSNTNDPDAEIASTAASLGLHIAPPPTSLYISSFLPSEAQRVQTPPASQEPRLDPFSVGFGLVTKTKPVSPLAARNVSPGPMTEPIISSKGASSKEMTSSNDSATSRPGSAGSSRLKLAEPGEEDVFRLKWNATGLGSGTADAGGGGVSKGRNPMANMRVDDVPEHLPTSPLCPRHPKHRFGGKGWCPIHGGNPQADDERAEGR